MYQDQKIYLGKSGDKKVCIDLSMANRHGLIAGATGSGKTTTLKVMAEAFSDAGVPVFLADIKGDLAGLCQSGYENEDISGRIDSFGLREEGFDFRSYPTVFWDVYGEKGLPLRTTVSEMGPLLLGRILGLNDTQMDVLSVVFRIADDEGLLLIDTKDLRSMLSYVSENCKEYSVVYGNIAKVSLGAIQRSVIALEDQGGQLFLGEPALNITDWLSADINGRGTINILDCQTLALNPVMYSTFLLWMLSELYETLPEVGDGAKPKIVFFFDEAHMLFDSASKNLQQKIEQVVKLIRSKGVGVYFITQNPADIPDAVLSQLGNKVQHALHAYTPAEQRGLRAAANSFRVNPEFDTIEALQNLAIGDALVSVLDDQGIPTVVEKTSILPPQSLMGAIDDPVRMGMIQSSPLYVKYGETVDNDSAYEFLMRLEQTKQESAQREAEEREAEKERMLEEKERLKQEAAAEKERLKQEAAEERARQKEEAAAIRAEEAEARRKKQAAASVANSAAGTIGREVGNAVGKTVGGSFGKKLGGNVGASLGRGILKTMFKY